MATQHLEVPKKGKQRLGKGKKEGGVDKRGKSNKRWITCHTVVMNALIGNTPTIDMLFLSVVQTLEIVLICLTSEMS